MFHILWATYVHLVSNIRFNLLIPADRAEDHIQGVCTKDRQALNASVAAHMPSPRARCMTRRVFEHEHDVLVAFEHELNDMFGNNAVFSFWLYFYSFANYVLAMFWHVLVLSLLMILVMIPRTSVAVWGPGGVED